MILKLYKSNISIGMILIPVVALVISLQVLFNSQVPDFYSVNWQSYVFDSIYRIKVLDFFLTLLILIINSILIAQSFNQTILFSKTTYLPAILYLILISFLPTLHFSAILIIHFLFIFLYNQVIKINSNDSAINVSFKSGLLIGLISCFELYYSIFILLLFLSIFSVRSINLREIFASVVGLLIPLVYLFSLQYIFGNIEFINPSVKNVPDIQIQLVDYVKFSILIVILIIGLTNTIAFNKHNSILSKKQIYVYMVGAFICVLMLFSVYIMFGYLDFSVIIPLVYVLSVGSLSIKNDSLISLLLTIALIINIVSIFFR